MSNQLKFIKKENGTGSRIKGKLVWGAIEFNVITGGYGRGPLPDGSYVVETTKVAVGNQSNMKSGFVNPLTNRGWFIPLTPKFSTNRHGFGIHPDGNLPGTKGCVGLVTADIKKFWDKWLKTPMSSRPKLLVVSSEL